MRKAQRAASPWHIVKNRNREMWAVNLLAWVLFVGILPHAGIVQSWNEHETVYLNLEEHFRANDSPVQQREEKVEIRHDAVETPEE